MLLFIALSVHLLQSFHDLFSEKMKIDFYDAQKMEGCVHSLQLAPFKPVRMCCANPSVILFQDWSTEGQDVKWLDVTNIEEEPKRTCEKTIHTGKMPKDQAFFIYCVSNNNKNLLILVTRSKELCAFNIDEDKIEWEVKDKLLSSDQQFGAMGLTADENGHIFVCDPYSRCVQMFSADGEYLGMVLKEGAHGMGTLTGLIQWFETTSSLVVTHTRNQQKYISVIKLEM